MKSEEFKELVEKRVASYENKIFGAKEAEYTRNGDRLHNFKAAGQIDNEPPERALWGMMKKHLISIKDMINDIATAPLGSLAMTMNQKLPDEKTMTEKFDDIHNYLHLLEALIEERRGYQSNSIAALTGLTGLSEHYEGKQK